jgi:hypothetical protein
LRAWKVVDEFEGWPDELMKAREGKLRLGLDAASVQYVHVRSLSTGILEQRRLPDSRLSTKDKHIALRCPCRLEERADASALSVASDEHRPSVGAWRSHFHVAGLVISPV